MLRSARRSAHTPRLRCRLRCCLPVALRPLPGASTAACLVQDLQSLAEPLSGNLQELCSHAAKLCNQLLAAPPGSNAALLREVAGGRLCGCRCIAAAAAAGASCMAALVPARIAAAHSCSLCLSRLSACLLCCLRHCSSTAHQPINPPPPLLCTEAAKYFTDACFTLQALAECLPQAAALLLHPSHHGAVLLALGVLHTSLLPLLARLAQQPDAAAAGLSQQRVQRLAQAVPSLVFHLLRGAFCSREGAATAGPHAAAAAAAAAASAAASSSGSSSSGELGRLSASDAELQGQELMNLLMLLAHPGDHGGGSGGGGGTAGGLLAAVNRRHHLDAAVEAAVEQV